jgi:hypothetical protein
MIKALTLLLFVIPMASSSGAELAVQFRSIEEQALTVTVSSGGKLTNQTYFRFDLFDTTTTTVGNPCTTGTNTSCALYPYFAQPYWNYTVTADDSLSLLVNSTSAEL